MRPNEDWCISQPSRRARADVPDPLHDERRFRWAATERGRADIQQDGTIGGKSNLPTEGVPIARGRPIEPLVEALGAGHDDAIGGNSMQGYGLLLLRVIPDE